MAVAVNNKDLVSAEQYARDLFTEKPNLGIDDAARLINERCRRGLMKPVISRIRMEVRQRIEAENLFRKPTEQTRVTPVIVRKRQIFNPIRVVVNPEPVQDAKAALMATMARDPQSITIEHTEKPMAAPNLKDAPQQPQAPRSSTTQERKQFLETWALNNPLATIEAARDALKAEFDGVAMGTKIISDTLREARRLYEADFKAKHQAQVPPSLPTPVAPAAPTSVSPIQQQVAFWSQQMQALGIRLIEVKDDGGVRVEFQGI